jgi:hypothetical protein
MPRRSPCARGGPRARARARARGAGGGTEQIPRQLTLPILPNALAHPLETPEPPTTHDPRTGP